MVDLECLGRMLDMGVTVVGPVRVVEFISKEKHLLNGGEIIYY